MAWDVVKQGDLIHKRACSGVVRATTQLLMQRTTRVQRKRYDTDLPVVALWEQAFFESAPEIFILRTFAQERLAREVHTGRETVSDKVIEQVHFGIRVTMRCIDYHRINELRLAHVARWVCGVGARLAAVSCEPRPCPRK